MQSPKKTLLLLLTILFLCGCETRLNFKNNTNNLFSLLHNLKSEKVSGSDKDVLNKLQEIYNNYKILPDREKAVWRNDIKVLVALMSSIMFRKGLLGEREYLENVNNALALDLTDLSQWSKEKLRSYLDSPVYEKSLKLEDNLYLVLEAGLLLTMLDKGDIKQAENKLSELKQKFTEGPKPLIIDFYEHQIPWYAERFKTNDFTSTSTLVQ